MRVGATREQQYLTPSTPCTQFLLVQAASVSISYSSTTCQGRGSVPDTSSQFLIPSLTFRMGSAAPSFQGAPSVVGSPVPLQLEAWQSPNVPGSFASSFSASRTQPRPLSPKKSRRRKLAKLAPVTAGLLRPHMPASLDFRQPLPAPQPVLGPALAPQRPAGPGA